MNPVNEQIRLHATRLFGDGYDYTYLYPGLQKVVQAAGRVIRSRSDRGVVHLIDDRFAQAKGAPVAAGLVATALTRGDTPAGAAGQPGSHV